MDDVSSLQNQVSFFSKKWTLRGRATLTTSYKAPVSLMHSKASQLPTDRYGMFAQLQQHCDSFFKSCDQPNENKTLRRRLRRPRALGVVLAGRYEMK